MKAISGQASRTRPQEGYYRRPKTSVWRLVGEFAAYVMAVATPWLMKPLIYGAIETELMRTVTMQIIGISLIATGVCIRVRWPLCWVPSAMLTGLLGFVMSPWHMLTVCVGALSTLVFFATQIWPDQDAPTGSRSCHIAKLLMFAGGAGAISYALIRMVVLSGFPFSLAGALQDPRTAECYLRDNRSALREKAPGGLTWTLHAAKHAPPALLSALLIRGGKIDDYDWSTLGTPLEWLASNAKIDDNATSEKALILARYGAPPGGAVIAARRKMPALTKVLVSLGDDCARTNSEGISVIGALIRDDDVPTVSALLAAGVSIQPAYGPFARNKPVVIPSEEMRTLLVLHGYAHSSAFVTTRK